MTCWGGVMSQSHRIIGGTSDEVFQERCFLWERILTLTCVVVPKPNKTISTSLSQIEMWAMKQKIETWRDVKFQHIHSLQKQTSATFNPVTGVDVKPRSPAKIYFLFLPCTLPICLSLDRLVVCLIHTLMSVCASHHNQRLPADLAVARSQMSCWL